jgi:hypothetical protein
MPKNIPSLKPRELIRVLISPPYVLRIFRQFGFADEEIEKLLK